MSVNTLGNTEPRAVAQPGPAPASAGPSAAAPSPTLPPAPAPAAREPRRLNLRMIAFAAIILIPLGAIVFTFLSTAITHGIHNRGDLLEVDLKMLGNYAFDKDRSTIDDVPEHYRKLDGKRVLLKGYPVPLNSASGTAQTFQLVYNVQMCCFNGPPQVQERVFCTSKTPFAVDTTTLLDVVGTLHVPVSRDGNTVLEVYTLDVDSVAPAQ